MAYHHSPKIVTSGLVLALDAANPKSYPGSGTTWYDLAGNDLDVSLGNSPTYSINGKGSILFNGSNQFGDGPAITGVSADWTVCIWFYPTSVSSYENPIDCNYSYGGSSGNIGPRLEMNNSGNIGWVWSGDNGNNNAFYYSTALSSGLTQSIWHFAALSRTSANTVINYLDGEVKTTTVGVNGSPSATFVNEFVNLNLGRGFSLGGTERYFTGGIGAVQLYNRALTSAEIHQNYNALRRRFDL